MYATFRRRSLATDKELARIRRVFDKFDKDQNGYICEKEIEEFIEESQKYSVIFRVKMKSIFKEMDCEQDGKITFKEFETYLRSSVCTGVPIDLSEEDSLKLAFKAVDKDGNGKLSLGEIVDFMGEMGYPAIFARVFLDSMDNDRNQMITFEQFKEKLENNPISLLDSGLASLHRLFKIFDKDGSGFIEASDLTSYIEEAESASIFFGSSIRQAVSLIDSNQDGKISFDEFAAFLQKSEPMAPQEEVWSLEDRILEISECGFLRVSALAEVLEEEGYDPERFLTEDDPSEIKLAMFMARLQEKPLTLKEASSANLKRMLRSLGVRSKDGTFSLSSLNRQLNNDLRMDDWFIVAMRQALRLILAENPIKSTANTKLTLEQIQDGLRRSFESQGVGCN